MAEAVLEQIKVAPRKFFTAPVMALSIGLLFMILVMILESFKPGLITNPIRKLLQTVGFKTA